MLVDIVFVEFESRSLRLNLIPESPAGFYQVIRDAENASSGIFLQDSGGGVFRDEEDTAIEIVSPDRDAKGEP